MLLCDTNDDRSRVDYYLDTIADHYAFGAVICASQVGERDLDLLEERNIRTITVDRTMFSHPYSGVDVDQFGGENSLSVDDTEYVNGRYMHMR